ERLEELASEVLLQCAVELRGRKQFLFGENFFDVDLARSRRLHRSAKDVFRDPAARDEEAADALGRDVRMAFDGESVLEHDLLLQLVATQPQDRSLLADTDREQKHAIGRDVEL